MKHNRIGAGARLSPSTSPQEVSARSGARAYGEKALTQGQIALLALLTLAGCAAAPALPLPAATEVAARETFLLPESPPVILSDGQHASGLGRVAERAATRVPERRAAPLRVEAAMLPFLRSSPPGARFLAASPSRALARGEPAEFCPVSGLAGGAPDPEAAADRALRACVAALAEAGAPEACGCRLLALDDALFAPREAFAYAPGVSARFFGLGPLDALPLVARESAEDAARRLTLRSAGGVVARGVVGPEGEVRLRLADGRVLTGRSEPLGWRRGRLAEILRLRTEAGAPVTATVGLEPEDLAALTSP